MIAFKCLGDCNAELIVLEANRPITCWNCGRAWTFEKGQPTPSRAEKPIYEKLQETRPGEVVAVDIGGIEPVPIEPAPIEPAPVDEKPVEEKPL